MLKSANGNSYSCWKRVERAKSEVKTAEYIIGQNLEYEKHYKEHYIDPLYVQSKPQNMKKPLSAAALEIYEKSVSKMENKLLEKDKNSDGMPKLKAIMPKLTDGTETIMYMADLIPMAAHIPLPWIMGYDIHSG